MPGHMFVGYWLDENHNDHCFLETTRIGAGRQPRSLSESFAQFNEAVEYANTVFNREVQTGLEFHIGIAKIDTLMSIIIALVSTRCGVVASDGRYFSSASPDKGQLVEVESDDFDNYSQPRADAPEGESALFLFSGGISHLSMIGEE